MTAITTLAGVSLLAIIFCAVFICLVNRLATFLCGLDDCGMDE